MAEPDAAPQEVVVPEDPDYALEEHVIFKRKQEILTKRIKELLQQNLSEFSLIMDGTTYAFTKLDLTNMAVSEVNEQILEYPHLRKVNLGFNLLKSVDYIAKLKFITDLDLSRNKLTEARFLSQDQLPYLKSLNLAGNKITFIPLIAARNIRKLIMNNNMISSAEEFAGSATLEHLELRNNKLASLRGLADMPKLQTLYLAENPLESLNGLNNVPSLARLHLRKCRFKSMAQVPNLPALKYVNLRENLIAKLDDIKGVPHSAQIINMLANPVSQQLGDNVKKEAWIRYRHYNKINKQEISAEEKQDFDKEHKDRLAEQERQRLEKETAEREAAAQKAAEEPQ